MEVPSKYIEVDFLTPNELVSSGEKTKSLNLLEVDLNELLLSISNKALTFKLNTLKQLVNEARNISMYKFQFKSFEVLITKEIKNIREYIVAENIK